MPRERANGEGTLYHDVKRDRWIGAVNIDGHRRKVVSRTKTEANRRLRELITAAERGDTIGDGNATVSDAIERWETRVLAAKDIAPATRDVYRWCTAVLRQELGPRRLRSLTIEDVEDALTRLASPKRRSARPLGHSALIKLRSVLGQVLANAQRRQMVNRNVARDAELPDKATRTVPRSALTPAEARTLRGELDGERLGAMFLVMLTVGLRPGEAAGILWSDLNLETGTLSVRHAVRLDRGRPELVAELKTDASSRTLSLPAPTVAALKAHKTTQAAERLAAASWADERLVFATGRGAPLSPSNVRRDLARICAAAGVPVVSPNELRHSAASILSDAGVPLEEIADMLGHESTRMLNVTYRHRVRPSITAAVTVMDDLLAGDG